MTDLKSIVIAKHFEGKNERQILREISGAKINSMFIWRTNKLFHDTLDVKRCKGSGKKRSVRTLAIVKVIRELI